MRDNERHDQREKGARRKRGRGSEGRLHRPRRDRLDDMELIARVRGQMRLRGAMEALGKKEKDAQVVLELTQTLASNLDFRGILFTVVQRLAEVAKVDRVSIVLVSERDDVGYVVAASDRLLVVSERRARIATRGKLPPRPAPAPSSSPWASSTPTAC